MAHLLAKPRDGPHGDGSDAHGVRSLRSRGIAHMGTEATHMALSACEAVEMVHMGTEATAYVADFFGGTKQRARRFQLTNLL